MTHHPPSVSYQEITECACPLSAFLVGSLNLPLDHLLLDRGDRLRRIETLRAGFGAVHDGVAAVQPERIFQVVEPLAGRLVAAVVDPAVGLQQCGGGGSAVAVPPVARGPPRVASVPDA